SGGQSDTDTLAITIGAVNDPPVSAPDTYSTSAGSPLTISAPGLLANDTDIDSPTLTAIKASDPAHGTLVLSTNGGFRYTPARGFSGTDTSTYQATDGTSPAGPATVTIVVTAASASPAPTPPTPTPPTPTPPTPTPPTPTLPTGGSPAAAN